MGLRSSALVAVGMLSAAVAPGCVVSTNGNDLSVDGHWTIAKINGIDYSAEQGRLADLCARAGVSQIRALIYLANRNSVYTELTADCAQAGFDTGSREVLDSRNDYDVEWQALDASGTVLNQPNRTQVDIYDPYHIMIPGPDFEFYQPVGNDVSLAGSWQINATGDTLSARCKNKVVNGKAVDKVAILVFDPSATAGATSFLLGETICETDQALPAGVGDLTAKAAYGVYGVEYLFSAMDGTELGRVQVPGVITANTTNQTYILPQSLF